jgi:pimeloyl-ACP methyl ester carboxylesterase
MQSRTIGFWLVLALLASPLTAGRVAAPGAVPGVPLVRHQVRDPLGRIVTYYVSHPARAAPLMLMIQGSGCEPIVHSAPRGSYSTLFDLLPFAKEGKFTVMAVEKPFSGQERGAEPGTAIGCSPSFNADFTAESWLAALEASLGDARHLPWIDRRRTLVFGHSEGAVMAALLAGRDRRITDAIIIGGSGTSQLFDFIVRAYRPCPGSHEAPCADILSDIDTKLRAIQAAPGSTSLVWGHPYRRWSSFFRIDPGDALMRSKARVYIAFGTADQNVPPLSQEVLVGRLLAAGRDVTVRRVPGADHMLAPLGTNDFHDTDREYRRALDWFWKGPAPSRRAD